MLQAAPDICCAAGEVSKAAEASKHSLSQTLPASIGRSAIRETEPPKLLGWGQLQLAQLQLCAGEQRTAEDCTPLLLLRPCMLLNQRLSPLQPCLHGGRVKDGTVSEHGKALDSTQQAVHSECRPGVMLEMASDTAASFLPQHASLHHLLPHGPPAASLSC